MRWFPKRVLVGKVDGRILIGDSYVLGEWRRDPWPGFDLEEGEWELTRANTHRYERTANLWLTRARLGTMPPKYVQRTHVEVCPDKIEEGVGPQRSMRLQWFSNEAKDVGVWLGVEPVANLCHLLDGEPDQWRAIEPAALEPIHALIDGKWAGAIMPVRRIIGG